MRIREIFQKQVWVESPSAIIGTYKWVNRLWWEAVLSILAVVGVALLVWLFIIAFGD